MHNFSNLFLEQNSTCFGQFLCPSSGFFHYTHSNGVCHTCLLTACEQQAVSKHVWHIPLLCVQWKAPDDGQRNCPKHVNFYSKNKFEKLVHLVTFFIRTDRQTGGFVIDYNHINILGDFSYSTTKEFFSYIMTLCNWRCNYHVSDIMERLLWIVRK